MTWVAWMPIWPSSSLVRSISAREDVWARAQGEPGAGWVLERVDCCGVGGALLVQAGQRSQAGRVDLACLEEVGPRAGKLEQPDGVAGGGGVEDDVVVDAAEVLVCQHVRELVERGHLRGARA
jgi:hypothetical protein